MPLDQCDGCLDAAHDCSSAARTELLDERRDLPEITERTLRVSDAHRR
jgi:hypothetical protein